MSTAGKVLTVLIMLVMFVWLVMMSAVTQLNVNYGQKIQKQQTDLDDVTKKAADTNTAYLDVTEKARQQQDITERDLRIKLAEIAAAERRLSTTQEALSRLKFDVADYEIAVTKAKTNLENRENEKIKGEENKAKKLDEIAKAQALNAELKAQLAQLQEDFKKLLADNSAKIKAPSAKPVSIRPESPSS
jgi:chromosome segregation ATPase